jgi:prolyl 4-hydroxylase
MRLLAKNLVMVKLCDLVKVYDNALEPVICQKLIELFESLSDKHERIENERKPNFTQLNLTEIHQEFEEIGDVHQILIKKTLDYKKDYYTFVDERCFPQSNAFEQFRVKRYLNDGNDAFDCHVDVIDYSSSRRFLSFFWYLNTVEEGGETVFEDLVIKPEVGKLVVFPPMWMFPHYGKSPVSNNKYIISTYLHYK